VECEDWVKLNNLRKRNNPRVVYMHPKDMIIDEGDKLAQYPSFRSKGIYDIIILTNSLSRLSRYI
jgi:hypothetical protein